MATAVRSRSGSRRLSRFILFLLTWPYYRSLVHRTLRGVERLRSKKNPDEVLEILSKWMQGKRLELKYVAAAATVSAAGGVSVFGWQDIDDTLWSAKALWYTSLILAIWALIATAQEGLMLEEMQVQFNRARLASTSTTEDDIKAGLSNISQDDRDQNIQLQHHLLGLANLRSALSITPESGAILSHELELLLDFVMYRSDEGGHRTHQESAVTEFSREMQRWRPSRQMLFLWQLPIMAMSCSWVTFMVALTVHIIRPLLRNSPWNDDCRVAILYLCVLAPCILLFFWSAAYPPWREKKAGTARGKRLERSEQQQRAGMPDERH